MIFCQTSSRRGGTARVTRSARARRPPPVDPMRTHAFWPGRVAAVAAVIGPLSRHLQPIGSKVEPRGVSIPGTSLRETNPLTTRGSPGSRRRGERFSNWTAPRRAAPGSGSGSGSGSVGERVESAGSPVSQQTRDRGGRRAALREPVPTGCLTAVIHRRPDKGRAVRRRGR